MVWKKDEGRNSCVRGEVEIEECRKVDSQSKMEVERLSTPLSLTANQFVEGYYSMFGFPFDWFPL